MVQPWEHPSPPLWPALSCLTLHNFLHTQIITPLLLVHYIDDVFILLMTDYLDFMTALNNFHPSLHFTFTHSLFSVNFLDLAIYKGPQFQTNQHVGITTHQKQHNLYQYLRFTSMHTRTIYKGLIIRELIRYMRTNTSSDKYIQLNPNFSKPSYLQQYPLTFVNKSITAMRQHKQINYSTTTIV